MSNEILPLKVGNLFNSGTYVIPIYQRNYAWKEPEITQLIQDIYDFAFDYAKQKNALNYYIGTLVVYERKQDNSTVFETIDGQQRLTTLNLVLCALQRLFQTQIKSPINYSLNLKFDSRIKSTETLEAIAHTENGDLSYLSTKDYNVDIQQAYRDTEKALKGLLTTEKDINRFYSFLTDKVYLMRVPVPADTDLNHYFEIMNSRGEQLEKHEVLKARLLEYLNDDDDATYAFNLIWEACADMERYVQYGFSVDQRTSVFSDGEKNQDREFKWNNLTHQSFSEVQDALCLKPGQHPRQSKEYSLEQIAAHPGGFNAKEENDESPDRFSSIINFSNFLLHVLRVQTKQDVSLDDKRLIDLFDLEIEKASNKIEFVKEFGYSLLKCKYLFDQYIIKREYKGDKDQWSLKRLKWYKENRVGYVNTFGGEDDNEGENKAALMLLSMFHVSAPTLVYKHWLNAALKYMYDDENTEGEEYVSYLKDLAQAFLFDRYIAEPDNRLDYFPIIYKNSGKSRLIKQKEAHNWSLLNQGTDVENFIFNYLDFKLWENKIEGYQKFEFASRSSVEHYYPRNPIAKEQAIAPEVYDLFGNLCLISRSKNSKLSNYMPQAKKDHYYGAKTVDSLKQGLMLKEADWTEEEIRQHGEEMIKILKKN